VSEGQGKRGKWRGLLTFGGLFGRPSARRRSRPAPPVEAQDTTLIASGGPDPRSWFTPEGTPPMPPAPTTPPPMAQASSVFGPAIESQPATAAASEPIGPMRISGASGRVSLPGVGPSADTVAGFTPPPRSEATMPIPIVGEAGPSEPPDALQAAVAGAVLALPPLTPELAAAAGIGAAPTGAAAGAGETLADVAARERAQAPVPAQTTSIADLARAHDEAASEHAVAEEVDRQVAMRKKILVGVALALVGTMIGTAGALVAVSRGKKPPPSVAKVGIQAGLGVSSPATTVPEPTLTAPPPTATAAQIGVVIVGLGDGSNESAANLTKLTQQRLPLTFAILPQRPGTSGDSASVQASGGQVILYLPVGGSGSKAAGQRGSVSSGQSNRQFSDMITRDAASMTGSSGILPFGFATGKYPAKADRLIPVMAMRQNVFILQSSLATDTSMAAKAKSLGVHYVVPDYSLDAKAGEKYFRSAWTAALARADKHGKAVAMCRLSGLSARVLPSLLAGLDTNKFQLTLVSAMP
jgi:polysaccharide deacetylase 2 family uncharacterized protein YibQ